MFPMHRWCLLSTRAAAIAVATFFMVSAPGAEAEAEAEANASEGKPAASSRGFYLRAGIGIDWSRETRFMDRNCASAPPAPAALYGCGQGSDGAPLRAVGDFGSMIGFEIGVGHFTAPSLRLEGTVRHRPHFSFDGYANFTQDTTFKRMVSADASSLSAMVAAYLDLPELGVPRLGPFSPFIGGGIGVSRIEVGETRMGHPDAGTTTIVPGGDRVNFAWMLTAGIARPIGERATLDFSWRYTDLGTVETGQDKLRIAYRDGRPTRVFDFDLERTRAELKSHGLGVSVRYAF